MRTGRNQDGNVDNLVLISNKDFDLIFWYNVTFTENLQGHFQEILPHLLYCFLLFSCFIHIHTHTSFFSPESFVICRHDRSFYIRALVSTYFPKTKTFLSNCSTFIKIRQFNTGTVYYLIHSPYSIVANCPNNIIFMVWGRFCFSGWGFWFQNHTL